MLSIIIVNYLQKELLGRCLASITDNLKPGRYEIIVVNNSNRDDLAEIKNIFPGVLIIPNENTGFSKANNLAAKQAAGEYLLFLNADTEFLSDFTNDLFEKFSQIKYGAIGLGLQFPDGSFQNSFGLFPTILNEKKNRKVEKAFRNKDSLIMIKRETEFSQVKEVDWVSGAALFIKKNTFEEAGGFDERYFMYYEDIDLCHRLKLSGYKNYYYPFSKIMHHKGENTRGELNPALKKIQSESQKLYYKLHNNFLQNILLKIYRLIK